MTTARNDLGVIFATSEAGRKAMLPGYDPTHAVDRLNPGACVLAGNALRKDGQAGETQVRKARGLVNLVL